MSLDLNAILNSATRSIIEEGAENPFRTTVDPSVGRMGPGDAMANYRDAESEAQDMERRDDAAFRNLQQPNEPDVKNSSLTEAVDRIKRAAIAAGVGALNLRKAKLR